MNSAPVQDAARPVQHPIGARAERFAARGLAEQGGIVVAFVVLLAVFAVTTPHFASVENLLDVARQISVTAILGAGLTFVILTAGIDLSVGSAVGVTAFVAVALALQGAPTVVVLIVALVTGIGIGLVNGVLVARFGLAPFIVTLAALTYLRGIVYVGTGGKTLFSTELSYSALGQGELVGVPIAVLVMIAVFVAGWWLLNRTVFGRHVQAVGGNADAARLAGIPVRPVLVVVYVIAGLCTAIGGIIASARLQTAVPDLGTGYELSAIAAVVLGGTSLSGGRGSLVGTLVGAAIIGVLTNGMTLLDVSSFYQQIIQGVVIVLAVAVDRFRSRIASQ